MRLLFVNHRLDFTSTSSYTLGLATSLRKRGERVRILTAGGRLRADFRRAGIETYRARFNFFSFRKLIGFLRDFDPDLIHVQHLPGLPLGRRVALKLGKPHLVTVHRRPDPKDPRIAGDLMRGVIAVSEGIREALVNRQNLSKGLIRVIRRGVDLTALKPEAPGREESEGKHIPVVGTVGRLTREKGHHTLIAAARRILDGGLPVHFVIVGEGDEEPRLRALVKKLQLERYVTFSPHAPSLTDLYRMFDIVALPVLKSGVGATALEAMAMGKPIVGSAVGEMVHIVQNGRTGVLVPEGDAGLLADRIVDLLIQPDLMQQLGRQARAWVEENCGLSPMVEATCEFYGEVISQLRETGELQGTGREKR
jgi:glycosyltransferase involved in cell wall biosynthesis